MTENAQSRLSNFQIRRSSAAEGEPMKNCENTDGTLKLTLPSDQSSKSTYQPSSASNANRSQTRFLKGRIDKSQPKYEINGTEIVIYRNKKNRILKIRRIKVGVKRFTKT